MGAIVGTVSSGEIRKRIFLHTSPKPKKNKSVALFASIKMVIFQVIRINTQGFKIWHMRNKAAYGVPAMSYVPGVLDAFDTEADSLN